MNLHEIASTAISAINPSISAVLKKSDGYTIDANGTQQPTYIDYNVKIRSHATSESDLRHIESLNLSGILRRVYISGQLHNINRLESSGGDLLIFDEKTWLIVHIIEQWGKWCSAIIQLQVT